MTEEEFKIRTFAVKEVETMDRENAIKFLRKEYPSEAEYILSITIKCHE